MSESWQSGNTLFGGPIEADETCIGGKERNKHADKKPLAGRGGVGRSVVAGAKDRAADKISARALSKKLYMNLYVNMQRLTPLYMSRSFTYNVKGAVRAAGLWDT